MADGDLSARVAQLEASLRKTREEVEALSVLVLSRASSDGYGGADGAQTAIAKEEEEAAREAERRSVQQQIEALEQAWVVRSAGLGHQSEAMIARIEDEVKNVWGEIRALAERSSKAISELSSEVADSQDSLKSFRAEVLSAPGLSPHAVEVLVTRMIEEVNKSIDDVSTRGVEMEAKVARLWALDETLQVERGRSAELEKAMEVLVQQCRADSQAFERCLKEMDMKMRQLSENGPAGSGEGWRKQADALKADVEDLRSTTIPSMLHHSTGACQSLAAGLRALRDEVTKLQRRVDSASSNLDFAGDLAAVKAELPEVKRQVKHSVVEELKESVLAVRADVSADVATLQRELREFWAEATRRLSSLEIVPEEQALMRAEVSEMRTSHKHMQAFSPLLTASASASHLVPVGGRGASPTGRRDPSNPPGPGFPPGLVAPLSPAVSGLAPRVHGQRVEWLLTAGQLAFYRAQGSGGPIISDEVALAGVSFRLKFFPNGSAFRRKLGHCSLYLLALDPVSLRFRLFAGSRGSPVLEATSREPKDIGRHDLCPIAEALRDDGSIALAAELFDIKPVSAGRFEVRSGPPAAPAPF